MSPRITNNGMLIPADSEHEESSNANGSVDNDVDCLRGKASCASLYGPSSMMSASPSSTSSSDTENEESLCA